MAPLELVKPPVVVTVPLLVNCPELRAVFADIEAPALLVTVVLLVKALAASIVPLFVVIPPVCVKLWPANFAFVSTVTVPTREVIVPRLVKLAVSGNGECVRVHKT